ncbi:MAG: S49 family peptidase [Rhodospirillaceae bacterium]
MSDTQPEKRGLGALPVIGSLIDPPPTVNVIRLAGVIGGLGGFRRRLTLHELDRVIERAFKGRNLKAVALAVNSPGGSPVQSALIAGRIRQSADEKNIPVYAFAEDVAASGGYWLACAGDEIYADQASIIGSIGAVSGGFGLDEMIKKLGIERRLYTAGDKKAMLNPFQPEKAADVQHPKDLQADIHENFKAMVRDRRGKRLKGAEKDIFSGAFWTGGKALTMGLVDGLGDARTVLR